MKLNEYLGEQSLFTELNGITGFPITGESWLMDTMLLNYYGERTIFKGIETQSVEVLAQMIMMNFGDSWVDLVHAKALELKLGKTKEVSENVTDTEARTNERENLNKVSAFNSDELTTDDGSNSQGSDSLDANKVRVLDQSEVDTKAVYKSLSSITKRRIITTVMADVSGFITLSIY